MAVRSSPVEGVHWRVSNRRGPGIGDRISQGICGFLVGVAMVVGASTLLFWNEVLCCMTGIPDLAGGFHQISLSEVYVDRLCMISPLHN